MVRLVLGLIVSAVGSVLLGRGYYDAFRSGVLTVKGLTSRREHEPIAYWLRMSIGVLGFLLLVFLTGVTGFLILLELGRR